MLIQVRNRGFEQQELRVRFAHDLDPVAPRDDHAEAEVREVCPTLPAVQSALDWTTPRVERGIRNDVSQSTR